MTDRRNLTNKMSFFNSEKPLGIPEGSVRALIALSITFTFTTLALQGKIEPKDFIQISLMVIAFYFGTRSK